MNKKDKDRESKKCHSWSVITLLICLYLFTGDGKRSGHRRGKKGGDKQEYLWGMWMKKPWKKEKREKLLAEDSVINN